MGDLYKFGKVFKKFSWIPFLYGLFIIEKKVSILEGRAEK
ncbi:hypothetical protein HMPREF3187_01165 [Aerococcus christensenii]|uniref:Uncharacterized protein n=1 Tax=Aerococcus christensenii TaxID=87541 RepID=A0A133XY09_9LACT|nr:hypothetical protein HMPREF3187_01165 [Aerococcus christensenii]